MITTSTTTTNCKRYITLIDEFLERKEIENILTLQTFGKYTMYKGLYMKLMKYNYEYVLKHNNIVSGDHPTLKDLGITGTSIQSILPKYIYRFREGGQFG